jgi:hypothetical protein
VLKVKDSGSMLGSGREYETGLRFTGEWRGDRVWEGTGFVFDGGDIYLGTITQGKYEGSGTLYYSPNFGNFQPPSLTTKHPNLALTVQTIYKGSFSAGIKNGTGILYQLDQNEELTLAIR